MKFIYNDNEIAKIDAAIEQDIDEALKKQSVSYMLNTGARITIPLPMADMEQSMDAFISNMERILQNEDKIPSNTREDIISTLHSEKAKKELYRKSVFTFLLSLEDVSHVREQFYKFISKDALSTLEGIEKLEPKITHGTATGAAHHFQKVIEELNREEVLEKVGCSRNKVVKACELVKRQCIKAIEYTATAKYVTYCIENHPEKLDIREGKGIEDTLMYDGITAFYTDANPFYLPSLQMQAIEQYGTGKYDEFLESHNLLKEYPDELLMDIKETRDYLTNHVAYPFYEWMKENNLAGVHDLNETITNVLKKSDYIKHSQRVKDEGILDEIPDTVTTIATKGYENALSVYYKEDAKAGMLFYEAGGLEKVETDEYGRVLRQYLDESKIYNKDTCKAVSLQDSPVINLLFGIAFKRMKTAHETGNTVANGAPIRFDLSELAKKSKAANKYRETQKLLAEIKEKAGHFIGFIKAEGYKQPSEYAVMNFQSYDAVTHVLTVSCPYLDAISSKLLNLKVAYNIGNEKGEIEPIAYKPAYHQSKNKNANATVCAEWIANRVLVICKEAGRNVEIRKGANAKPLTLLKDCPYFEEDGAYKSHKTEKLERIFGKVFSILRENPYFENFIMPDLNNPKDVAEWIPTAKTLDGMTWYFKRKPKKKQDTGTKRRGRKPKPTATA